MSILTTVLAGPRKWSQGLFFVLDILWIVGLVIVIIGTAAGWAWLIVKDPFGGVVPFVVPWAGALGGVSISLVGVAKYADETSWNSEQYGYWHLARPFLGCIFGTISVLIVILLLQSLKVPTENSVYTPAGAAILAIISFVVGYREETFRTLVARVVDVVLGPGTKEQGQTMALIPSLINFPDARIGETASATVHVFNGSSDTVHLTAGAVAIGPANGLEVASFTDVDLTPNGSQALTVNWRPTEAVENLDTVLRVSIANVNLQARVTGNTN
jgi:hypothetical protein